MTDRLRSTPALDFLLSLATLERIPLTYLLGDPEALPPESLRFFYLDIEWIDHLLLGALSAVGEQMTERHVVLMRMVQQILAGDLRDPRIAAAQPPRTFELPIDETIKETEPPLDGPPVVGFLLRSALVGRYPTMRVEAQDMTILMNRRISRDTMLVLLTGRIEFDELTLSEPAWGGLSFGVDDGDTVKVYSNGSGKNPITFPVPATSSGDVKVIDVVAFAEQITASVKKNEQNASPAGSASIAVALTQAPYTLVLKRSTTKPNL